MAIDKEKTKILLQEMEGFFESLTGGLLPNKIRDFLQKSVMGPALGEVRDLIENSRPPVLLLAGRSGHGKSSLINALTGRKVAEVGDVRPTTPESAPYLVFFPEQFSSWKLVDSRGIFESTRPKGAAQQSPETVLYQDILKYNPDVILHAISAPELRSLSEDLKLFASIQNRLEKEGHSSIPVLRVITKADTLGNPREWPPESHPKKAAQIEEALDYLVRDVLNLSPKAIRSNFSIQGYQTENPMQPGVVPVCSLPGELWNIETLQDFIGKHLPESSLLEYYQALRRKEELRHISTSLIKRFSLIASGIGASPAPLTDMVGLLPLQLLMIAMIGGLSCRPVSKETALEYLSAAGLNMAATTGLRYLTRELLKFLPIGGWAASGSLAGSGTWALGKAAESWFFSGQLKKPEEFQAGYTQEKPDTD